MPESSPGRSSRDGFYLHLQCVTYLGYTGKQASGSCSHIPLTKKVKSTSNTMILPVFLPWPQQFVLHKFEMLQYHAEVTRFNLADPPSERKSNHTLYSRPFIFPLNPDYLFSLYFCHTDIRHVSLLCLLC